MHAVLPDAPLSRRNFFSDSRFKNVNIGDLAEAFYRLFIANLSFALKRVRETFLRLFF